MDMGTGPASPTPWRARSDAWLRRWHLWWPRLLMWGVLGLGVAAVIVLAESSHHLAREALEGVDQRHRIRYDVATLFRRLNQVESAQRGYLLTGRDAYFEEVLQREQQVNEALANLRSFYANTPYATKSRQLDEAIRQRYSELAKTIELYRAGKHEAWQTLVLTDIGREKMEEARAATADLLKVESAQIGSDLRAIHRALNLGRVGAYALTAVGLTVLLLFLRKNALLHRLQQEAARDLKAERDRLDAEVMRRTDELTELARHLQTVREDERARLARELHDELGGLLTAAKLDLARLMRAHRKGDPELLTRLAHMGRLIDDGIALKRRIIEDLRPSALTNLGLIPALEILTSEFAERTSLKVNTRLDAVPLVGDAALAAYRFIQESLTNVSRHAQARQVWVELRAASLPGGGCELSVRDDGCGFDLRSRQVGQHGLMGMRYRIEALGGHMQIRSNPGQGCAIHATLPLD